MSKKSRTEFVVPKMQMPAAPQQPPHIALSEFYEGSPTGNAEVDSKKEISAVLQAFQKDAKGEAKTFVHNTASNFYGVIIFQTLEQLQAFCSGVGVKLSDPDLYIDGCALAAKMNIPLPTAPKFSRGKGASKKILSLPRIP